MALSFGKKKESQSKDELSASPDGELLAETDAPVSDGVGPSNDSPNTDPEVQPAPLPATESDVLTDLSGGEVDLGKEKREETEETEETEENAAEDDADLLSLFESEEELKTHLADAMGELYCPLSVRWKLAGILVPGIQL